MQFDHDGGEAAKLAAELVNAAPGRLGRCARVTCDRAFVDTSRSAGRPG